VSLPSTNVEVKIVLAISLCDSRLRSYYRGV
jgi:hypothetical protein